MSSNRRPLPLIVSSPSGAGKTTLTARLLQRIPGLAFSVSHTTRQPRATEPEGREYHFVSRQSFVEQVERGGLPQRAEVPCNLDGES